MNDWVEYFANVLKVSCEKASEFERLIKNIKKSWLGQVAFRADSAGRQLVEILPGTPVISIKTAQKLTGKSYPAVRSAVLSLEELGILRQNAKNRKSGIYVADDVMRVFNLYERSFATLSGDTVSEKPRRHVPQRVR